MTDGKSKSLVAYHEVGHAVCGTLTPGHDQVQKVTPRLALIPLFAEALAPEKVWMEGGAPHGDASCSCSWRVAEQQPFHRWGSSIYRPAGCQRQR